jgi:two-component system, cell cycle sensor histidine kinase and response regulator CckA
MKDSIHRLQSETPADYSKLIYRRHYQAAIVSSVTALILWPIALIAFLVNNIQLNHFLGISLSILYLLIKSPFILWFIKHTTRETRLDFLSMLFNLFEILGYTCIIYFLGGIEATYLTPLYAALISYVGVFAPRGIPYILAILCSAFFSLMVAADYLGFLPHQRVLPSFNPPWHYQLAISSVVTALLLVVAYVSSYTSNLLKKNKIKLRNQNNALLEKTILLEEKEKALELAHQGLEQRVEERTGELKEANERLQVEIRERQQAEQVLKESEEKYRQHFENINDVIYSLDRELIIRNVSPSVEKVLGYKPGELLGRSILELRLVSPPFFDQALSDIKRVLAGGSIASSIYEFIAKDRARKFGEVNSSPLIHEGKIVGLVSVARDITERKQVEEALHRSEAFLKRTQEISNIGGWEYDVAAKRMGWTDEVYRIYEVSTDYDPTDIQKNCEFYSPQDRLVIERAFWKAVEEGEPYDLELQFVSARGTEKWVRTTAQSERIAGKTIRVFGNIMDITERKEMEEQRVVISKLESTGILAGGIAHDFNNLLSAILGNLELIMMEVQVGEEVALYSKEISKAVWKARDLTKQLITFAGGGDPITKLTVLSGLMEEQVRFTLSGSPVDCQFSISPDLWQVVVDEAQIRQVIRNIVLNAREALPEGGTVLVKADNLVLTSRSGLPLPAGKYMRVSIIDQGSGISKEILPKIFDPYFSTRQRGDQKGMGLGLTICHSIIRKHGGVITVDSQLGEGTTFHIYLPAVQKMVPKEPAVQQTLFKTIRILVMDDEELMRDLVKEHLRRMGYEVEVAENGNQAVDTYRQEKAQGHPFDAVMLDLTVRGGMGGKDAIQELIKIDPTVKAIVCSGYDNDPVMEDYKRYGFKGALPKPFLLSDLSGLLSRVIGTEKVKGKEATGLPD